MVGEKNNVLKNGNFKKGDLIQARIIPFDGKVEGKPYLSPQVRILNSSPEIEQVWIEPRFAHANEDLKVIVKAGDKDSDFTYFLYQWEKNGTLLPKATGQVLEKGVFKKGDSIAVVVTPDDREVLGKPKRSEPVVISNSPPIILSSPPTSSEGTKFVYQVKAHDPDDDPIHFTLIKAPKRMEIDKKTGLIGWEIQKEDKGTHVIEIEAADNGGAKSIQRFTLNVAFK